MRTCIVTDAQPGINVDIAADLEANFAWAPPFATQTQNVDDDLAGPESISLDEIDAAFALLTDTMVSSLEVISTTTKICEYITQARQERPDADTLNLAKKAGRKVSKFLKHATDVMAIPPIVLSCAMEMSTCTEWVNNRAIIVRAPDWGAIGYDDRRIMKHPQRNKAMRWMASGDSANGVGMVKVRKDGLDWQVMLQMKVYQQEMGGQHIDDVGARMNHKSLTEEAAELGKKLETSKLRQFGSAKRKAEEITGKQMEREQGNTDPRKGNNQRVAKGREDVVLVMKDTEQHGPDARGRKRRRTSGVPVESSDLDFQIGELTEAPSGKEVGMTYISRPSPKSDRESSVVPKNPLPVGRTETITEVDCNGRCTPCKERGLECIIGHSKKTGNRLNSCGECTRKKQKCFYGKESETVGRGRGRATSRAKSRVRSQTRMSSPAARSGSPSRSHRSIVMGSPHVVAPNIEASSATQVPVLVDTVTRPSIEERLWKIESGIATINNAIEKLVIAHEVLRQTVVPQRSTFPLPRSPSLPVVKASALKTSLADSGTPPVDPCSSTSIMTGVQADRGGCVPQSRPIRVRTGLHVLPSGLKVRYASAPSMAYVLKFPLRKFEKAADAELPMTPFAFVEPLGAFMEMEVDHPVSPSLESTDHGMINFVLMASTYTGGVDGAGFVYVMDASLFIYHLYFGLLSRPRYQDDGDSVLDDESELDFGLHPSGATTDSQPFPDHISIHSSKPLDLGMSMSPPPHSIHVRSLDVLDGDSVLDDGSELDFGLHPRDATAQSCVGAGYTEPLVLGTSISPPPLYAPALSSNLDVSDGDHDSVLDDESELDFGLHPSGATTETQPFPEHISIHSSEPLDRDMSMSPPPHSIHVRSLDVLDGDSVLDDGSELDFGLYPMDATAQSCVGAGYTEPLVLGTSISPPPLYAPALSSNLDVSDGDHDSVLDDESELDFGLHPSDAAMASSADTEDVMSLDFERLGSDHAHRSSKYVAGPSSAVGVEPALGALPPSGGPAQYTPSRYGNLPTWASQSSLVPAVNEFNKKYRRRETQFFADREPELLSLPGAPTDDPIPAAADLYEFLARDTGEARSSQSGGMDTGDFSAASGYAQPHHEPSSSSEQEDVDIPLSEEELLKLSRSILTQNRLNAVTTEYAHRLVNEVADGDEEQVHPTLQDILEAERPFHVAYLETTENFRKTLRDLQRAVRLHDQTLQLQAQLDAMIAAVESQERVFG
ncbi:hypothetical protein BDR04DRAFT_1163308 [Suillus decipiens]|nr:hypothetical protein BDR04DRAFT_1163308 [Suillus decipiens]